MVSNVFGRFYSSDTRWGSLGSHCDIPLVHVASRILRLLDRALGLIHTISTLFTLRLHVLFINSTRSEWLLDYLCIRRSRAYPHTTPKQTHRSHPVHPSTTSRKFLDSCRSRRSLAGLSPFVLESVAYLILYPHIASICMFCGACSSTWGCQGTGLECAQSSETGCQCPLEE